MKSIKKLFKFLPAMCLAVLSGLSAILFQDHKLNSTYAYYQTLKISTGNYQYSDIICNSSFGNISNRFTNFTLDTTMSLSNNVTDNGNIASQRLTFFGSCVLSNNVFGSYDFEFSTSTFTESINNFDGHIFELKCYRIMFASIDSSKVRVELYFSSFIDGILSTSNYLYGSCVVPVPSYVNYIDLTTNAYWNVLGLTNDYLLVGSMEYNSNDTSSSYDAGFADGYGTGYGIGYNEGSSYGTNSGYENGYNTGYQEGVASQQSEITDAYNNGYADGYQNGFSSDTTVTSIFSGILQVGMLPVNVLLAIFNFEILGINLSAFISAILTVCLTVIVIRNIKGGSD